MNYFMPLVVVCLMCSSVQAMNGEFRKEGNLQQPYKEHTSTRKKAPVSPELIKDTPLPRKKLSLNLPKKTKLLSQKKDEKMDYEPGSSVFANGGKGKKERYFEESKILRKKDF